MKAYALYGNRFFDGVLLRVHICFFGMPGMRESGRALVGAKLPIFGIYRASSPKNMAATLCLGMEPK
jgi:hypothetical protein